MSAINRYNDIRKKGETLGESKCCAVIAIAVALDITFEQSWNIFHQVGRRPNQGTTTTQIKEALNLVGVEYSEVSVAAKTVKSFRCRGNFIVLTCNHALSHQYGETLDHSAGTRRRIERVFKIEKIPTDLEDKIDVQPVVACAPKTRASNYKYAIVHAESKTLGKRYKRKPNRNLYWSSFSGVENSLHNLEVVHFDTVAFLADPDAFWENLKPVSVC